jgi:hypothetical protein
MRPHRLARATETIGLSEIANNLLEFSGAFADQFKDRYHDTGRRVRRLRIAGEAGIALTRRRIKSHPLAAVGLVASGAFILGGLLGHRRRRHRWLG